MTANQNTLLTSLLVYCVICMHVTGCAGSAKNSTGISDSTTRKAIIEDKWIFTATYVIPQGGRSRPTNDVYTVQISEGKLTVALPYFGRAWGGGSVANQSPLNFTSTDFAMTKENVKGEKWSITIKPKDYNEVQSLNFTFFESGSANLNVTLANRSAITFNGNVAATRPG